MTVSAGGGIVAAAMRCNPLTTARRVCDIEIEALRALRRRLRAPATAKAFTHAVDLILDALRRRGKLIVCGVGKSGNVGEKISATFASTGATSVVLHAGDAVHGDLGILADGDVVIFISYSGETDEILNILPAVKRFDVRIIALTGNPRSTLARYSDAVLDASVRREACPHNMAPTASTTTALVMGDALAMALLEARGFSREDFGRLHPAGTIGRSLLLRIRDIMRAGDRNPVIKHTATVKEALLAMTRAKSGTISVVNGTGKLAGVFTDGDFRRHIARDENILRARVSELMTRNPITVRDDALAVEALKIFQRRAIDDLVVVDAKRKPVGIVDSQDLPKFKVM